MANEQLPPLKSYCKRVKDFDFSQETVIDRLSASADAVNYHYNRMKQTFTTMSEQEIWQKVNAIVVRDNVFNAAMQKIVPCYEMHFDEEELNQLALWLKSHNPSFKDADMNILHSIAQRMMEKQLVFEDLQKLWGIEVTTEEVIGMLKKMYEETNHPIREIVNNPERIEALKPTLLEQKMADAIIGHLKYKLDEEAIRRNAEESARQNAELQAKIEAERKAREEAQLKEVKKTEKEKQDSKPALKQNNE